MSPSFAPFASFARHLADLIVLLVWAAFCIGFACYDATCEGVKKLRLGRHYEGPLED